MTITLNGQGIEMDSQQNVTLAGLLQQRALKGDRVAIERNGEIVPRALWQETRIEAGDRIEVVHFVGGGAGSRRT